MTRAARPESASGRRSASSKLSVSLAIAALVVTAACGPRRQDANEARVTAAIQNRPGFDTIESPAMEFLPRGEEVPEWEMMGDPLVYPANALRGYIGRQSQQYLDYEVLDLTIGEYQRPGGGRATVEIYRFPDFVKAFGAYSQRRGAAGAGGAPVNVANEAFAGPHWVHLWRGAFYVRFIVSDLPEPEAILPLVRTVAERMPEAPGKPAVFGFFPVERRIAGSETYSAGPVFGQPYLAGGFTARFAAGEGEEPIEAMILPAPTKEVAADVFERWQFFFASNGRLLDPVPNLGEDNFVGEDRFMGRTVTFRLDRFVVAFRGYGEVQPVTDLAIATHQRILGSIRQQLQAAEKAARAARAAGATQ